MKRFDPISGVPCQAIGGELWHASPAPEWHTSLSRIPGTYGSFRNTDAVPGARKLRRIIAAMERRSHGRTQR